MDKAIDINPETIKASIESAFKDLMTNPNLKNARTQLAAMVVASQTVMGNVQTAFADELGASINSANYTSRMSYGRMLEYVNDNKVQRVTVSEDGRKAFIDLVLDGQRPMQANADLVNDPTFFD